MKKIPWIIHSLIGLKLRALKLRAFKEIFNSLFAYVIDCAIYHNLNFVRLIVRVPDKKRCLCLQSLHVFLEYLLLCRGPGM
jgi:hypothetical protein